MTVVSEELAKEVQGLSVRGFAGAEGWRVLVVEDRSRSEEGLTAGLERHGHRVQAVETGADALEAHGEVDLVLLDLELSDADGIGVCRAIRSVSKVPIIVAAPRASELDCVLALQGGADDYAVKHFGFRELMARMDAVMRRAKSVPEPEEVMVRGPLSIDLRSREVLVEGVGVPMSRKEFDLLVLLASNPGSVVPRECIMRRIWDGSWSRRTVDTHVSSIRKKLGGRSWIVTVRGVGFRFQQPC